MSKVSENLYSGNVAKPASTAATNTTPYGFSQTQADALIAAVRALIDANRAAGVLKDDTSVDAA